MKMRDIADILDEVRKTLSEGGGPESDRYSGVSRVPVYTTKIMAKELEKYGWSFFEHRHGTDKWTIDLPDGKYGRQPMVKIWHDGEFWLYTDKNSPDAKGRGYTALVKLLKKMNRLFAAT